MTGEPRLPGLARLILGLLLLPERYRDNQHTIIATVTLALAIGATTSKVDPIETLRAD